VKFIAVVAAACVAAGAAGVARAQGGLATAGTGAASGGGVTAAAMPASLTGSEGDPARGRKIIVDRQLGLCLLCHSGPFEEERFQGNLAPDLRGTGRRLSAAQLRLIITDPTRRNANSIMPSYYRTEGLVRVAAAYRGKTVLSAEQIEDVVAFLATLRDY
jgi:sulfur-oxidizing protein SoxX